MPPIIPAVTLGVAFAATFILDEKTAIPVGSAVFVCSAVFWVGRKYQRLADKIDELDEKIDNLPCPGRICEIEGKRRKKCDE